MKHYITIALCTFLSQMCTAQVMMLFSQDSLTGIASPLDVDSLFYWFAADVGVTDSLGGAIATDEGVGTWNDLSGNGHHVTQSTNGARPVYKATGGPGSKPCIQFDGTDDFLASDNHFWGSDDLTVFVVMKFGNATRDAQEGLVGRFITTGDNRQWLMYGTNAATQLELRFNTHSSGTGASAATWDPSASNPKHITWKLQYFQSDGSDGDWYVDGTAIAAEFGLVTTIYDYLGPIGVGATNTTSTAANFLQGSISEIIVYTRALSATERTAIENYLNRKYDLY